MPFFNHRNNLIHAGIAVALSAINIFIVITLDPPNAAQGIFGNIFYIHVPVSWTAFLLYFMVMISGIMFLTKKESDHLIHLYNNKLKSNLKKIKIMCYYTII